MTNTPRTFLGRRVVRKTRRSRHQSQFITDIQLRPSTSQCNGTRLTTETVQSAALALEGIDNVEGCDGLALGVLGVGDSVTDDTLEEGLEDTTGLLVDHWRGTLAGCKTRRAGVGDILAEIRLTPPRRARRRIAGLVIPWMLSRRILRWRLAPPLPRPLPPFPPVIMLGKMVRSRIQQRRRDVGWRAPVRDYHALHR